MVKIALKTVFVPLVLLCNGALAGNAKDSVDLSQKLDDRTQELKLRVLDLNREINKYAAKSGTAMAQAYKGKNRAEYSLDFVFKDYRNKHFLAAINRYHTGRDFGVILSKYETALRVANIYLDYGLYHYAKKIFKSLLGDEDSAVASLARFYLAKHDFLKHNWGDALVGFESVRDGLPLELLDRKRIMQGIILQSQKRHDEVIKVLSEVPRTSANYNYAQFNIAMSYLRKGWSSDAEETIHAILNSLQAEDPLTNSLRDRLYIALGYYQLQREFYREAEATLNKVSVNGLYGYKARIGLGIVAAEQGKYKASLKILSDLKKSYSNQLVAEEAYIVIPFILESIGSVDVTTKYYHDAAKYYAESIQDVAYLESKLNAGNLDSEIINTAYALDTIPGSGSVRKMEQPRSAIRPYVSKMAEDSKWNVAIQNAKDIEELQDHLDKLHGILEKSGKYGRKSYRKLQTTLKVYKKKISALERDYKQYLRRYLAKKLDERENYFVSYLNQSKYALARIFDTELGEKPEMVVAGKTITNDTVRSRYRAYLKTAVKSSRNRRAALIRLAELEFNYYEQLVAEGYDGRAANKVSNNAVDKDVKEVLAASISLMQTVLADYPDDKNNDQLLYQLALAYDKQSKPDEAIVAMRQLVDNYPQSRFYTEIQFKLGENYLTTSESIDAELAYSAAIRNGNKNSKFYQRALYKRGWSRLRQSIYEDALSDFFEVLELSHYSEKTKLNAAEREFMEDVFRAISICFSDMGGLERLNEYFNTRKDNKFAYVAYEKLGELYESQDRLHDAVGIYKTFVDLNPMSPHAPQFLIKIVNAWKIAGLPDKELEARALLETKFTINSPFWSKNAIQQQINIRDALEANVVYMASHYHGLYQKTRSPAHLQQAKYWYEQFTKYAEFSKQAGKTYFLYAELLSEAGESGKAIAYYEKAGDGADKNVRSAKEAAYAAILTTDNLLRKSRNSTEQDRWLFKKAEYSRKYITDYPKDKRAPEILLNAIGGLYERKLYNRTLAFINKAPQIDDKNIVNKVNMYKAHCLFALDDYASAEKIYQNLYALPSGNGIDKTLIGDRLASTIYKEGEVAQQSGKLDQAIAFFKRVTKTVPGSEFSATANFDAANLLLKQEKYDEAGALFEAFLQKYPGHRLQPEVNSKLAVIYLNQSDKQKSASAFLAVSDDSSLGKSRRRDALWAAAELFNDLGDTQKALELYKRYSTTYSDNHEQAMEARTKLAGLYEQTNNVKQFDVYQSMVTAEARIRHNLQTDRTRYLAAHAAVKLMERDIKAYKAIAIREPLKKTLKNKKQVLKELVAGLTKVSNYAIEDTTTWALYNIGEAYREFSRALLESPRPVHLSGIELEQYELLLEEQAYPFEEKALGFYKENLGNVKSGVYNEWVKNSLLQLARMVPARYNKREKLAPYIDIPLEPISMATQ